MIPQVHTNPAYDVASFVSRNKFGEFTISSRVSVNSWEVGQKCRALIFRYKSPDETLYNHSRKW